MSWLERWTFLVLMLAMMNGAAQLFRSSSKIGLCPVGCLGPSKPGVSENGSLSQPMISGCVAARFMVSPNDAAVPPENVPFILRTRPRTREKGLPLASLARC